MKSAVLMLALLPTLQGCMQTLENMNRNLRDPQRQQMINQSVENMERARGAQQQPIQGPVYTNCSRDLAGNVNCISH